MIKTAMRRRTLRRADRDDTSLGNILVQLGYATAAQIKDATAQQGREQLGAVLIEAATCTVEQIEHAVLKQRADRGEATAAEVGRLHRRERRVLMRGVLDGLRDVSELGRRLVRKYEDDAERRAPVRIHDKAAAR